MDVSGEGVGGENIQVENFRLFDVFPLEILSFGNVSGNQKIHEALMMKNLERKFGITSEPFQWSSENVLGNANNEQIVKKFEKSFVLVYSQIIFQNVAG